MKLKKNFVLREVVGTWVVLPLGVETVNFSGMLQLNDSGAFLWRTLENGGDKNTLIEALLNEYEVTVELAEADVDKFLTKLNDFGCLQLEKGNEND